jgi:hypothetical protein
VAAVARPNSIALAAAILLLANAAHPRVSAAEVPNLAGRWTLNRNVSQIPSEVGFGMDLMAGAGGSSDADDRTGGGVITGMTLFRESADDARRLDLLVEEVRTPSPHLTIAQTDAAVTITNEQGQSRTFHPHGKSEFLPLDQVSVLTTSRWDGESLDVRYLVQQNRELRYIYSRSVDPPRLVVEVRFVERGGHLVVKVVYEPSKPGETAAFERPAPKAGADAAPPPPAARPSFPPAAAAATPEPPASPRMQPVGAIRPDAELRGLTALGVVVEDVGQQAAGCGLNRAALEAAVTKSLTDAGLKTLRDSDEDSYVYVRITTATTQAGLCVSSYDVYLYTHTTATLPYQAGPTLVQVELLHRGGMTGGSAGTHGEAVGRSVKQVVDEFASRIRKAAR